MNWYLLAIISVLASSLTTVLRKKITNQNVSSLETIIVFQFIGAFLVFLPTLHLGFSLPPIQKYPINFILQGVLWGMSSIFLFMSYKKLEASEVAILTAIETLIAVVLGVFLLNEILSFQMLTGAILVFIAIIIVGANSLKRIKLNSSLLYISIASVFAALAVVNDAFLIKKSDGMSYLSIAYLLPGIFVYIFYMISKRKIKINANRINFKYTTLLAACSVAAGIPFYMALYFNGQISQVIIINKSSVIFTILFSALLLNEKDRLFIKFACAALVILGVILLGK